MAKESTIMQYLKANYQAIGLDMNLTYDKTVMVLKIFRKASWCTDERFDELNDLADEQCVGDFMTYLFHFAPEKEMQVFQHRATSAAKTRTMLTLIKEAAAKIKEFPNDGNVYFRIIDLKYINDDCFGCSDETILQQLDLQRSTYYRKKKEAVLLLGMLLFGLCVREFMPVA